jgi:hypothetical protein
MHDRRIKKMPVVDELIREEADGTISFGDYRLDTKSKVPEFEHSGDSYKLKTFNEITKLERNGMFVYESVPGTAVGHFSQTAGGTSFDVEGNKDAQITLGMEEGAEYEVSVNGDYAGKMKTIIGGKLVLSVELTEGTPAKVSVLKA